MREQATSLGRYTPTAAGVPTAEVQLLGLPVMVILAAREHHDGLVRELRLLALGGTVERSDVPQRLADLVHQLGEDFALARARRDEEIERARRRGDLVVDLVEVVPVTAAEAVSQLSGRMIASDELGAQGVLVTLPRSPVLRRFAAWYRAQYVDQIAGGPPVRWDGPLRP